MATGAGDDYWDRQKLPAVVKHCILRRYLPIFLARTSTRGRKVVVMDGYAGRGNYGDGRPLTTVSPTRPQWSPKTNST